MVDRSAGAGASDDRLAECDVAHGVTTGRLDRGAVDDRRMEGHQLVSEAALVGRDLLRSARAGRPGLPLLDGHERRLAAKEGRRERQADASIRSVERELHLIAGDPGQVDPGDRHPQGPQPGYNTRGTP